MSKAIANLNGLGFPKPAKKQGAFCFISFVLCLLCVLHFHRKAQKMKSSLFRD